MKNLFVGAVIGRSVIYCQTLTINPHRLIPYRSLPRTDLGHLDALETAQRNLTSLAPGEACPLSAKTAARLTKTAPRYRSERTGRQQVVGQQSEATSAARRTKATLRLYVTHFFQALNMAIQRGGGFRSGDRTYYGLDANQETLPKLKRETELLRVTENLVTGEAKRIAAGGKRITMPSAKEIGKLLRELERLFILRKQLVAIVDQESSDVIEMRDEVADLVRDIWDELEFAHRRDPAPPAAVAAGNGA